MEKRTRLFLVLSRVDHALRRSTCLSVWQGSWVCFLSLHLSGFLSLCPRCGLSFPSASPYLRLHSWRLRLLVEIFERRPARPTRRRLCLARRSGRRRFKRNLSFLYLLLQAMPTHPPQAEENERKEKPPKHPDVCTWTSSWSWEELQPAPLDTSDEQLERLANKTHKTIDKPAIF